MLYIMDKRLKFLHQLNKELRVGLVAVIL